MDIQGSARFSRCGAYRYRLDRQWDISLPAVAFIGLNPSTANATVDDPTIRRCIGFARDWGYGRLVMLNLFAYRATYPVDLFRALDPVGTGNSRAIGSALRSIDTVIACWGNHGQGTPQAQAAVKRLGDRLYYLRRNGSGAPAHPLYMPATLRPIAWASTDDR